MSIIHSSEYRRAEVHKIADGDAGAKETLWHMKKIVHNYPCKQLLAGVVARVTSGCQTDRCKIDAIYAWVRSIMRYQQDPVKAEQLKSPCRIMQEASDPSGPGFGIGDCDDFTIILCACYKQAGLKTHMLAVSSQPARKDVLVPLDHVTAVVWDRNEGKYISTDPVAGAKTWEGHRTMLEKL